ncbi:TRAP transporter large permease subunit [Mesobaculum littorinae]|uniref:TRAP transporter large permease protein n=1 Tax=Mesobaculum littorinae TaxID=2486419 RepID=A0A438AHE9_9RHOB|nr:TRAP transporter large permease subunit [Mesobaculum littorinae]RVV98130.1 TRAP transporter large permease subunit [Mesobaculum littorinae]
MDGLTLSLVCLGGVLALIAIRTPIGVALGVVSFLGFWELRNFNVALGQMREVPYYFAANWDLSAIPMFLLMGSIVYVSGIATSLFHAARLWLSGLPGGLAVAANIASAGFAAGCGSSVAAAAAMGRLAIPEMLKAGYEKGLATGVVASAGTIAALIPPSILMVLYGIFAETSIASLLIAGIIPGLLTAGAYTAMIMIRCKLNPALSPAAPYEGTDLSRERWKSLREIWPLIVLVFGVIGGLYGGIVTPTEAGAAGSVLALLIAVVQRRMTFLKLWEAVRDAIMTTAQIFFVGMGALMFTRLLSFSGASQMLTDLVAPLALDPVLIVLAMSVIYLILGMFLDPIGIMLITMPVFIPLLKALDFDLIWYGVLVVKFIEVGMLTPPLGFNVFVVKGVVGKTIPLTTIFRGVGWFLLCDLVVVILLVSFPGISLWLPSLMN